MRWHRVLEQRRERLVGEAVERLRRGLYRSCGRHFRMYQYNLADCDSRPEQHYDAAPNVDRHSE